MLPHGKGHRISDIADKDAVIYGNPVHAVQVELYGVIHQEIVSLEEPCNYVQN